MSGPHSLSLIISGGSYDRFAILRAAWAAARAAIIPPRPMRGYAPPPRPTLREAFQAALRRTWDLARGHRACAEHRAAMGVEDAHRIALPAIERETLALRDARALAPMTDSTRRMVAELSAIDARAALLGLRL